MALHIVHVCFFQGEEWAYFQQVDDDPILGFVGKGGFWESRWGEVSYSVSFVFFSLLVCHARPCFGVYFSRCGMVLTHTSVWSTTTPVTLRRVRRLQPTR